MRCEFCGAQATGQILYCDGCLRDPEVPSYETIKVEQHQWEAFSAWKEIWMTWWWIEGRRKWKNPLKKNGKPKKEVWHRMYCARSEESAKLLIRQIKASIAAGKEGTKTSKARDREIDLVSRYDEWRVIAPEAPVVTKRGKGPKPSKHESVSEKSTAFVEGTVEDRIECPGCGKRGPKKVKKGEKKLWKCLSCGRRWPRSSGEAPQKPSKGLEPSRGTTTAAERPRKRQKPAKKK